MRITVLDDDGRWIDLLALGDFRTMKTKTEAVLNDDDGRYWIAKTRPYGLCRYLRPLNEDELAKLCQQCVKKERPFPRTAKPGQTLCVGCARAR